MMTDREGRPTMRYRCLILDHDDTAVDSTRRVHYPAHVRAMEILRPGHRPVDLETWIAKNFDPGILGFLVGELGMSDEEMAVEEKVWREFTSRITPEFFPGFLDAVADFQDRGGAVVVASHSDEDVIRAHYRAACNGRPVTPDLVFGWGLDPELRKPSPYSVLETLRHLDLEPAEVLVVDDLKPGVDMAAAAGVDVAAAAWSHNIPVISEFMRRSCVATFDTVADFADFITR
jgi:phosphoglycolate phosphatase/pyrophosphatase PpaX